MDEREAKMMKETERVIHETLSPMEPFVMKVQSYLVWEKPRRSFALFILFHLLIFYVKFSGQKVIFIVSLVSLVIFFVHTWRRKIWPEIRVRPPSPEGDQWVPMHLGLLSVPEISYHMSVTWHALKSWSSKWLYLRLHHSFLFCVLNVAVLSTLAIIGRYISGFLLIYIFFTSLMLWPSVYYHDLPQKIYLYCEPVFMRLDYYLTFRGKFPGTDKRKGSKDGDTGSDDDDFMPPIDPAITAALARAITDSEDEEQTPPLSTQSSVHSSDENDTVHDLLPAAVMPDVIDARHDDLLFLDDPDEQVSGKRSKRRRPRAPLTMEMFEPPVPAQADNASNDVLSSIASKIVAEGFSKALASALGKTEPQEGARGGLIGHDKKLEIEITPDSDIDQMISEDFDFLEEEEEL